METTGRKGDAITSQEFAQLFLRYRDRFISIARSYIRDDVAAEDIVAESFTNFWDNRERVASGSMPEAYILQSVKNRNIFLSSRFENLTYNEIAEKYGISPRKVKREMQHALEILRTSLKDYLPFIIILYMLYHKA